MGSSDRRVDAYIARAEPFARPILEHLRRLVHAGCPDVEEAIKWRTPHFVHHGMLCAMAAFTEHVRFAFWKGELLGVGGDASGLAQFGRITSIADLPPEKKLIALVKRAAKLNEAGMKSPRLARPARSRMIEVPGDVLEALKTDNKARSTFDAFSPSHRREYVEWITEAKRADTRARRLDTMLGWLREGKSRNWKYERK